MSQRIYAAIAAVLGLGSVASAQYGQPNPYPVIPIAPTQAIPQFQTVQPQQPRYQMVMPAQASQLQQPTPTSAPSCPTCGTGGGFSNGGYGGGYNAGSAPYLNQKFSFGAGNAPIPYNEYCPQCANGCGSWRSNKGFIFGSCREFFNPCGPIPMTGCCGGGGCTGALCGKCGVAPFGAPYGTGYNTCAYDSYLNH